MKKEEEKTEEEQQENIIETFDSVSGFNDDAGQWADSMQKTSFSKMGFCAMDTQYNVSGKSFQKRRGDVSLVPNKEQMSSEFSKFNPVWLVFPVMNMIIDLIMIVVDVFWFVFKIVFFKTYELMIPNEFDFGLKSGKKYCFNLLSFRMLITFLCPPLGVFMAYGLRGFVQIGICAVLSLFFYIPGLIYGLIVILRSDVAEYIEQVELNVCADDGATNPFFASNDEKPNCSRNVGETCSVNGKPLPGNALKLDCCMQPKYEKGSDGEQGIWMRGSKEATDAGGNKINQFAEGELVCKTDFKTKLAPNKGICVYKSSGSAGTVSV